MAKMFERFLILPLSIILLVSSFGHAATPTDENNEKCKKEAEESTAEIKNDLPTGYSKKRGEYVSNRRFMGSHYNLFLKDCVVILLVHSGYNGFVNFNNYFVLKSLSNGRIFGEYFMSSNVPENGPGTYPGYPDIIRSCYVIGLKNRERKFCNSESEWYELNSEYFEE